MRWERGEKRAGAWRRRGEEESWGEQGGVSWDLQSTVLFVIPLLHAFRMIPSERANKVKGLSSPWGLLATTPAC